MVHFLPTPPPQSTGSIILIGRMAIESFTYPANPFSLVAEVARLPLPLLRRKSGDFRYQSLFLCSGSRQTSSSSVKKEVWRLPLPALFPGLAFFRPRRTTTLSLLR